MTRLSVRIFLFSMLAASATVLAVTSGAQVLTSSTDKTLPIVDLQRFVETYDAIKRAYVEPVSDKALFTSAINGMVNSLDPHSAFMNEETFRSQGEFNAGQFGGVGIVISTADGHLRANSLIKSGPAAKAGVLPGDEIVAIDGEPVVKTDDIEAITRQLRGEPNTTVKLTIQRAKNAPFVLAITRAFIESESVTVKMLDHGIAYIALTEFDGTTVAELGDGLRDAAKHGPINGILLDLRQNPGGLLPAAVGVSAAFIAPDSLVVSTRGQVEEANATLYANRSNYQREAGIDELHDLPAAARTAPMIVLVNGGTASAAEIVAGALQDYARATIMGTRTFGKGSVQAVLPLPPTQTTALKITTARYFSPKGRSIQNSGIVPDVEVTDTASGNIFPYTRESDLDHHLANPNGATDTQAMMKDTAAARTLRAKFEFGGAQDFQYQRALELLGEKTPAIG